MTFETWESDRETRKFDERMFASSGTTTAVIEDVLLPSNPGEGAVSTPSAGSLGEIVVFDKMGQTNTFQDAVCSAAETLFWFNPESLTGYLALENKSSTSSTFVLCRSLVGNWPLRSNYYILEYERGNFPQLARFLQSTLTRPVYKQLVDLPIDTRRAIQDILAQLESTAFYADTMKLPPLRLALLEDSSYLLEWTFEDRRLGFTFEANPKDSGWYYVYSSDSSERYESGTMDQLEMSRLIGLMLKP